MVTGTHSSFYSTLSQASAALFFNLADHQLPQLGGILSTLGSRGYFFLIDISRQSRVNEAQSAEEKKT